MKGNKSLNTLNWPNNRGDKMPPSMTPFETVTKQDVDWPHLMHISWLLYKQINILTINNGTLRIISLLIKELPVINTIKCLGRI